MIFIAEKKRYSMKGKKKRGLAFFHGKPDWLFAGQVNG
jgi:hypothetical protein